MIDSGSWAFSILCEAVCIGIMVFTWIFDREKVRAYFPPILLSMLVPVGALHALAYGDLANHRSIDFLGGMMIVGPVTLIAWMRIRYLARNGLTDFENKSSEFPILSFFQWVRRVFLLLGGAVIFMTLLVMGIVSWLK